MKKIIVFSGFILALMTSAILVAGEDNYDMCRDNCDKAKQRHVDRCDTDLNDCMNGAGFDGSGEEPDGIAGNCSRRYEECSNEAAAHLSACLARCEETRTGCR